jgi:RHS repeat-associated protein
MWEQQRGYVPPAWHGTLLEDKRESAVGLTYRRNRYYDHINGRFTQEDPIGLAGGFNLYGFATVDPVNFSDPFGLRVDTLDAKSELKERIMNDPDPHKRKLAQDLESARERFTVIESTADITLSRGIALDYNAPTGCPAPQRVPDDIAPTLHPATRGVVIVHPSPQRASWSDVMFHELAHLTGVLDRGLVNRRTGGGGCIFVHPYPQGDPRNPPIFKRFPVP